jgi:hypothetical protein
MKIRWDRVEPQRFRYSTTSATCSVVAHAGSFPVHEKSEGLGEPLAA